MDECFCKHVIFQTIERFPFYILSIEPSEPTLTATGLDKSIQFNWLAPDPPNGIILRYYLCYKMTRKDQVSIKSSDRKEICTVINNPSTLDYLVQNLGNYEFNSFTLNMIFMH